MITNRTTCKEPPVPETSTDRTTLVLRPYFLMDPQDTASGSASLKVRDLDSLPFPQPSPYPSIPCRSPISMPLAADVIANLLKSLKIVQSLGEAVPHGGVLKAIAGIGITILETAERVRQNKEECADIARRAAEHIAVLKRLDEDEELSYDLVERLERHHSVLKEVLEKVERLGTESKWKRTLRASSVQDETKYCLNGLNAAYQMYIVSVASNAEATDSKLTTIMRGMTALSLRLESRPSTSIGERSKIDMERLEFGEEITTVEKRTYVLRIEHGKLLDFNTGRRKAVILRRFEVKPEVGVGVQNSGLEEFKKEVELRGDLLNRHLARMLGVASSSTGRTKMIVIEAGYRFLGQHKGSWRGAYREILLGAKDKRLCMGGLGRMDGQWEDSGWRMDEAFFRLRDGNGEADIVLSDSDMFSFNPDWSAGGNASFEENAESFERMRESLSRWNGEKTEENAQNLWSWLWWWSGSNENEERTGISPSVGEIGWRDGNGWHPIPLVHRFSVAPPPKYDISASRWRDGERETIVGMQIAEYTRWSLDVSPGKKLYLSTYVRKYRTKDVADFAYGSALSLARDFGVDVGSLCQVSHSGSHILASLTISDEQFPTVYYFAYPPYSEGSVPDPPGFWSFSPDPRCTNQHLQVNPANIRFRIFSKSYTQYSRINDRVLHILQDLESLGFLPIPHITYASDPPFATISEVFDHQAPDPIIAPRSKQRHTKNPFSIFSKKRQVANS
ncbi:hypothetical protein SISNIDRAFT_467253 [Sistotremastrum niveocremeum HHB9708]|uniref:Mixed lineage kinase domain-containing protein n=1 Tax=Sistotremastrum niveocremeum HHB9708 TaxID=1314777 RepID=A0A164T2A4_9AGAM|nr:hypothetical protein SISNIDRAFT_467253 [Sistotremastrum niveocremeum HHB9708]